MNAHLVIISFVFLVALFAFYLLFSYLFKAANKYENNFTSVAGRDLSEIFIFIDPRKLFALNLLAIFVVFCVTFLASGVLWVAIAVSVIAGFSPRKLLKFIKNRRENRFLTELPDALMSISSMMKAGTNLSVALEVVVAETKGPIAQEFGLFLKELRMGVDFNQALDNLVKRMPLQELSLVVAGMKINREIGGSLAEVLYRLADTLRRKIEMEGKINALTAQGKAQGWVMSLLPVFLTVVLYQMEPEAMGRLFTDPIGWIVCFLFCIFLYLGYFFIKKIVSIDV